MISWCLYGGIRLHAKNSLHLLVTGISDSDIHTSISSKVGPRGYYQLDNGLSIIFYQIRAYRSHRHLPQILLSRPYKSIYRIVFTHKSLNYELLHAYGLAFCYQV